MRHIVAAALVAIACMTPGLLSGCSSQAVNVDARTTFLNADDMVAMTDQMAQAIVGDPFIAQASANAPLKIVIKPVVNETNEIIRDNRKELFVQRLRGLLASKQVLRNRFTWVMNREDFEKLRRQEFPEATLGPSEDRIQPDYALWAHFIADTSASRNRRSDTYLCQYKLTRLSGPEAGGTIWTGQYEVSKHIKKGLLD